MRTKKKTLNADSVVAAALAAWQKNEKLEMTLSSRE